MGNIRPPQFGVEKDELTLTTQDPNAVLYGVTPTNGFMPIRIDSQGRLEIATVTLDMSDIQIGAIEIKDHTTDDRASVSPNNELIVESRVHDGVGTDITSTLISGKQGLDVNVVGGSALSVSEDEDGDVPANQSSVGLLIGLNYGYNGVSWERVNSSSNAMHVDVQTSVLPTGAATEATLSNIDSDLDVALSTRASEATLNSFRTDFNATDFATETTLAGIKAQTDLLTFDVSNRLAIQNQPNFDVALSTRASEATLSSVDTKLTDASQKTQIVDGAGSVIGSTGNALDVNIKSGVTLEVNLDNANDDVLIYGFDGAVNRAIATDAAGNLQVDVLSSDLPAGAATEATLSSIDTSFDVAVSTRASESTISGFRTDFNAVDFATETTLALINGKITTVDTDDVRQTTHDNLNANANIQVGDVDVSNANPVPISDAGGSITVDGTVTANAGTGTFTTDPTDRVAREVGRVSGNHTIHVAETYNTDDTLTDARPTNGDFDVQHHKTKSIVVRNTGVNTADVQILGSVDGTNLDVVIVPTFTLSAGETSITAEERVFTHIRVEARSKNAGQSTSIVTKAYSLGV